MRERLLWFAVALICIVVVVYGIWWCCHSRKQIVDAVVNLYIKIFCER